MSVPGRMRARATVALRSPCGGRRARHLEGAAGQVLVLAALGMVAILALVALIIDGGNAWANQRIVQNGSDASAEAGAVVLARRFAGAVEPAAGWDATVSQAVTSTVAANGMTLSAAYYTDICGIPLKSDGSAALNADGSYDLASAQKVGSGLPASTTTTPDCPSRSVGPVAGVMVLGSKQARTYIAGVVGLQSIAIGAQSTAAAGYLQESCAASQGEACSLLPIAIPVNVVTCDNSGKLVNTGQQWVADGKTVYRVPMCSGGVADGSNGTGNVGWIDWTPTAGGTAEVIQSITNPNNPAIPLPSWQYVTQTGNPNSSSLESAIRAYDGQVVLVPQFDLTCGPPPGTAPDSSVPAINTSPNFGCPGGAMPGNGSNQWYRMPSFAHFQLCIATDPDCAAIGASYGAYITGSNKAICDTGNGATSCLVGKFESIVSTGTIGAGFGGGSGNSKAVGVQLIK